MNKYDFALASYDDISEIVNLYKRIIGTPGCLWSFDYPNQEFAESDIKNNNLYTLKREGIIIGIASLCEFDELSDLKWELKNAVKYLDMIITIIAIRNHFNIC